MLSSTIHRVLAGGGLWAGLVVGGCYPLDAADSGSELYIPPGALAGAYEPAPTPGELAAALGQPEVLLMGVGNDLGTDGGTALAWGLDHPPPLHYLYLVGLPGRGGWPGWNPHGTFVDLQAAAALQRGVVPVFTLYAMAVEGEGRPEVLTDAAYMRAWWDGFELAVTRLAHFGRPAMLHVEPDFWGFMQKYGGGPPDAIPALVGSTYGHCADYPDTLAGMGACIVHRVHTATPQVRVGLHASTWADPDPVAVAEFMLACGAGDGDVLFVETLDRDAGCFEARGEGCTRDDGPWYWEAAGQGATGFDTHLDTMWALHDTTGLPLSWWQMPMGVPSTEPGGTPGHYRDNRVAYVFEHPEAFVEAGGVAVMFGPGWPGQTDLTTDGGQFERLWETYRVAPEDLPRP